jgi:cytochrome P450
MTEPDKAFHPIGWSPEVDWASVQSGLPHSIVDIYNHQRSSCPVAWRGFADGQGFWSVFDYEDVLAVLNDPATFSSATPKYGMTLIPIEVDPPAHRHYRMLLAQLINPQRLQPIEDDIRLIIRTLIDELVIGKRSLLEVTAEIPIRAFCLLVGDSDPDNFRRIHAAREAANDPRLARLDASSAAQRKAANQPLVDYCAALLEAHRRTPREDVVSDILAGQIEGRPITQEEALSMLSLLYIAGNRTTTAALRGAVVQLAQAPDIQAALRADSALLAHAIEEIIRLETPVHGLPRYAMRDTQIKGCPIKKGEQVFPNFRNLYPYYW